MQETQKIDLYQKRDFGEKINATFAFLRQNFVPLGRCLLFIAGPLLLIVGVISGLLPTLIASEDTGFGFVSGGAINWVLSLVAGTLVIAVVHVYLDRYVEQPVVQPIEVAEVWEGVKGVFLKMLIAVIVVFMVVSLGFLFLIIPGFIFMAALSLIFVIMMREKVSFGDAFSRCFKLVSGNYLSTLLLLFVVVILQFMLGSIIGIPAMLIIGVDTFFAASGEGLLEDQSLLERLLYIIAQIINTVGNQLLSAITLVAIAFQYGNLIEKKEATGLMQDIDAIGDPSRSQADRDETY
jgi:hypothetical protein